jgi:hypothetical protein
MTKKQAAKALYISVRTIERRMQAGQYKFTKAAGQFGEVTFSYVDLGLPEPKDTISLPYQDEPTRQRAPEPPQRAFPKREPSAIETKIEEDRAFAEAYRAGEVTDSYGNTIEGTNLRCPTIGPQCGVNELKSKEKDGPPRETQSHMDPRLLATNDTLGNKHQTEFKMGTLAYWEQSHGKVPSCGFTEKGAPLAEGMTQEKYDQEMRDHRKTCGLRSQSFYAEQEDKRRKDRVAILASFPKGNATTASRGLAQ